MEKTTNRREKQMAYNEKHGITPRTVGKSKESIIEQTSVADFIKSSPSKIYIEPAETGQVFADPVLKYMSKSQLKNAIDKVRKEMERAAKDMDFLQAAKLRDEMFTLEKTMEETYGNQ